MNDINFFLLSFPFMYLLFTIETSYFIIDDDFFVVKYYSLPFVRIKYKLSEIESIVILKTLYRSFSQAQLQVKIHNKKSIAFRSACLKKKDWRILLDDFRTHNISFNEGSYDYFKKIKTYREIQEEKRFEQNN